MWKKVSLNNKFTWTNPFDLDCRSYEYFYNHHHKR